MPNPTRQEIIEAQLARQWAEWNKSCEVSSPEIQAAANFILANTPTSSMAEVEWDDDKHFMAEVETGKGLKAIMLHPVPDMGILCLHKAYGTHRTYYCKADYLTPTGRRYELKEVQE